MHSTEVLNCLIDNAITYLLLGAGHSTHQGPASHAHHVWAPHGRTCLETTAAARLWACEYCHTNTFTHFCKKPVVAALSAVFTPSTSILQLLW